MIILKAIKNQGITLSLEDKFFEKSQGEWKIDTYLPSPLLPPPVLGLISF